MRPAEWIDRYVTAVGGALPAKKAGDAELEIRSLIHDGLEAAGFPDPEQADEETVLRVLEGFGDPKRLAADSQPERYLIGPALFPHFITVASIVLVVVAGLWLFGIAVAAGTDRAGFEPLAALDGLLRGIVQTFATLVVVFALIERFTGREVASRPGKGKTWDVRSLPPATTPDRYSLADIVVGIGMAAAAIVIFNWYPHLFQGISLDDGEVTVIPLLSEVFFGFVPWLTALWLMEIALSASVLAAGHWRPLTRALEIGLSVFTLGILGSMLATGPLAETASLEPLLKMVAAVAFAIVGVIALVRTYRLVSGRGRGAAA
ncbi:MAG: hypothetical protein KKA32_01930 [Actinobacteria bacterium]|nr:hypothetical protein [Actinomycetota bacterium]